jgi:hypothetical protein
MAVLFYAEPTRTYDLDVFVVLKDHPVTKLLVSLDSIHAWARGRGFAIDAEHVLIHGVPVRFLPAYNALVEEAVATARDEIYEDVPVRVVDPVRLVALALQAGGARRRERALQIMEQEGFDRELLRSVLAKHGLHVEGLGSV